jgi:glucose-6-phosphate 1-dehydrogenase
MGSSPSPGPGTANPEPPGGGSIAELLLLGAVGDLACRHLLPALAHLLAIGHLPPELRVLGVGREGLATGIYRDLASRRLAQHAPTVGQADRDALVRRLHYLQADLQQAPDLRADLARGRVIAYLALPPSVYAPAIVALRDGGIAPGSRIVVEKPFGQDLATAKKLNTLLHTVFPEQDVFRADHFLHHQIIHDLLALRFANPIFEPLWNRGRVERVEITWEETAGVAGRAEFYDRTGALRDMGQSHLLQVLALLAMEPPATFDEKCLRDGKVAALRCVQALSPEQVATRTARGRYAAGIVEGHQVGSYRGEPGVDPARGIETYAYVQLAIDTARWRGVPFLLRTGKALGQPRRRIVVVFRKAPGALLSDTAATLCMEMTPDRLALKLAAAGPSGLPVIEPVCLEASRPRQPLPASARLLRDVLAGDPTLAVRDDEVEECWRVIDSVVSAWRRGVPALQDYPAGSVGPILPRVEPAV